LEENLMAEAAVTRAESVLSPLIVILGPTASGKSSLGVALAREFNGEIIACDSTQVYRGFDIGTAKPTQHERGQAAHHLLDLLDATEIFTAGEYRKRAIAALQDVTQRNRLPILTAGTGLYLRALLEGLADAPLRSEELRERLLRRAARNKPGYLHRVLKRMDAEAAARIAPRDTPKLVRAIEVSMLAGKPISAVHRSGRQKLEGFHPIKIGLNPPRTALYERIERRTVEMVERGWLAEVQSLLLRGITSSSRPFTFIGYAEMLRHAHGNLSIAETIAAIQQSTRRYAKRQLTWFRKEPGVTWLEGFGDDPANVERALRHIREQISGAPA
jgi:tRNA dimethylallyltransferase